MRWLGSGMPTLTKSATTFSASFRPGHSFMEFKSLGKLPFYSEYRI